MRRAKIAAERKPGADFGGDMRSVQGTGREKYCTWTGVGTSSLAIVADCPSRTRPANGMDAIRIRGARTHNLKNVNLDLPRNRLVVITGLSGSGKSSLAFDTLYAEGQRRYVESLSAYARQFLS